MDIVSLQLIYFSPTGTTKKVLEGIARGIGASAEYIDLTPPDTKARKFVEIHGGLFIIGAPVYGGRLPADAVARLRRLKGNGAPAVIVVVYGNRAYEDALLELRDLVIETGYNPVAAGAFIGEHSYSNQSTPIAVGRPDLEDMKRAEEFGKMVREKIMNMQTLDEVPLIQVPGNSPYKELKLLSGVSPLTQEALCLKCGTCASVCPTTAVNVRDMVITDSGLCIRCCACIKACPAGARTMEDERIRQVAQQLSVTCSQRKEPEMFL